MTHRACQASAAHASVCLYVMSVLISVHAALLSNGCFWVSVGESTTCNPVRIRPLWHAVWSAFFPLFFKTASPDILRQ